MPKNLGLYNDDLSTPRKQDVDACYGPNNPPPYPVTSINGQTGAVTVSVPIVPFTTNILKGDGLGDVVAATSGSDYIASGNITKQTLVAS